MPIVNESEFCMWRTLFAIAHADNIVTEEEVSFMVEILDDINFTAEQEKILRDDIVNAKDVNSMFLGITEPKDRIRFFQLARDIVWVDGAFVSEEQSAMITLYQQHMSDTTVDDLVGKVSLEFEEEEKKEREEKAVKYEPQSDEKSGIMRIISIFKKRLLGE